MNVAFEIDLVALIRRQRDWSKETYGPGQRTEGVIKHIKKELKEIEDYPLDLKEWIDVVILALDGAWRAGHSPEDIATALYHKQIENMGRKWPDWRTHPEGEPIEHIRDLPIYQDPRYQDDHRFDEPVNRDPEAHPALKRLEREELPLPEAPGSPADRARNTVKGRLASKEVWDGTGEKPRHLRTSLMEEEVQPGSPHLPRKDLGTKDATGDVQKPQKK